MVGTYPSLCVHTLPSLAKFHCDGIGRQLGILSMQLLSLLLAEMEVSGEWMLRELGLQLQQKVGQAGEHTSCEQNYQKSDRLQCNHDTKF